MLATALALLRDDKNRAPGACKMRRSIFLFLLALNKAGATSAGMRSQPFGSLVKALLDIGRRSGSYEPLLLS